MVPSCAEGGVLGVLCASIGSIMGTEAIKLITGIGETLLGRLMIYDALEMSYRTVKIRKDPNGEPVTGLIDYDYFCGTVSDEAAVAAMDATISVKQLKDMLDARDRGEVDFFLVDVREPNEWDIVSIPGAELIPKGEFLNGTALEKLPSDKPVVIHCKVGGRSAEVLAVVKGAGFADAVHVGGGVVAWVNQIEPHKASY
jgi:adenylyltransferase/sulfurtransferase